MSLALRLCIAVLFLGAGIAALLLSDALGSLAARRDAIQNEAMGRLTAELITAEAALAAQRGKTNGLLANRAGHTEACWARALARGG